MSIYIFDFEGTLIQSLTQRGRASGYLTVLPRRQQVLAELARAGHQVAIIASQPGVAFGRYSEEQFRDWLGEALAELGLPESTPVRICYADPHAKSAHYADPGECARQKPAAAMIAETLAAAALPAADAAYVGDQPLDEAMALSAGVRFWWASQFFEGASRDIPAV
ncbi:MAG TPA: HAD-IIIA family hydrolase [Herpetosiphonaceae bacterium]